MTQVLKVPEHAAAAQLDTELASSCARRKHQVNGSDRVSGTYRISALKRGYGWDRTRLDSTQGARTWTGYGILAHNLVKISALAS